MGFSLHKEDEIFDSRIFADIANKEANIFEEAGDNSEATADFARKQLRSQAMSCALTWLQEGDYSFQAIDDLAAGIADLDGDEELTEEEEDYYNELMSDVGAALVSLGGEFDNVQNFLDNEDDGEGAKLGEFLSEKVNAIEDDDDTIIANFAMQSDQVMEAMIKRVIGGKVVLKKKRLKRRVKLSAAQKAGLKLARRKAHTGAAKLARRKSMKIRKRRGI